MSVVYYLGFLREQRSRYRVNFESRDIRKRCPNSALVVSSEFFLLHNALSNLRVVGLLIISCDETKDTLR